MNQNKLKVLVDKWSKPSDIYDEIMIPCETQDCLIGTALGEPIAIKINKYTDNGIEELVYPLDSLMAYTQEILALFKCKNGKLILYVNRYYIKKIKGYLNDYTLEIAESKNMDLGKYLNCLYDLSLYQLNDAKSLGECINTYDKMICNTEYNKYLETYTDTIYDAIMSSYYNDVNNTYTFYMLGLGEDANNISKIHTYFGIPDKYKLFIAKKNRDNTISFGLKLAIVGKDLYIMDDTCEVAYKRNFKGYKYFYLISCINAKTGKREFLEGCTNDMPFWGGHYADRFDNGQRYHCVQANFRIMGQCLKLSDMTFEKLKKEMRN